MRRLFCLFKAACEGVFVWLKVCFVMLRTFVLYGSITGIPFLPSNDKSIIVIGNGPSLNHDIEKILELGSTVDKVCVNDMALCEYYCVLQPSWYILKDPLYFASSLTQEAEIARNSLIEDIVAETSWPMILFLPIAAKKNINLIDKFTHNRFIVIEYFLDNVLNIEYKNILFYMFKKGAAVPFAQNVLVAAIFIMIQKGYRNLFLTGADHDWHKDIFVDEKNRLCLCENYCYQDSKKESVRLFYNSLDRTTTFRMSEIFYAWSRVFFGYEVLEEYSKYVGAKIYNTSSKSFIDAFRRKTL